MYNHITPNNQWIWWLDESPLYGEKHEKTPGEMAEECKDLVQSTVDGHNVTIFACGDMRKLAQLVGRLVGWLVGWSVGHENGIDGYIFLMAWGWPEVGRWFGCFRYRNRSNQCAESSWGYRWTSGVYGCYTNLSTGFIAMMGYICPGPL